MQYRMLAEAHWKPHVSPLSCSHVDSEPLCGALQLIGRTYLSSTLLPGPRSCRGAGRAGAGTGARGVPLSGAGAPERRRHAAAAADRRQSRQRYER